MNTLGHPYVAYKVTGRINPYLVAGSHIPDLVPFVPDSVFSFEEIHESPDKFLKFLDEKYPDKRDLALGMMSHSMKFGADKLSHTVEGWFLENRQPLRQKMANDIVACSKISFEAANTGRMHNYIWNGVDVYLLRHESDFVRQLKSNYQQVDFAEVATLLAEGFGKDRREVGRMVDGYFSSFNPDDYTSVAGLVRVWRSYLAKLPQGDDVDLEKTQALFEKIYHLFEDRWEEVLELVIDDVRKRMEPFLAA